MSVQEPALAVNVIPCGIAWAGWEIIRRLGCESKKERDAIPTDNDAVRLRQRVVGVAVRIMRLARAITLFLRNSPVNNRTRNAVGSSERCLDSCNSPLLRSAR